MTTTVCGHESTRGTTLFLKQTPADVFDEIDAVEVMPELNLTAETDECTDAYGLDNGGYRKRYGTGTFDGGTATITYNWISGNALHDELYEIFRTNAERVIRIQLPDVAATKWDLTVIIVNWGQPLPAAGGKIQHTITVQINAEPVKS